MTLTPSTATRVAVLGPVLVEGRAGSLVEPTGTLGRSLLVALVLARGDVLSVASLIDELWGGQPPRQGKAALQTLVSRVRAESAAGLLVSSHGGYALATGADGTDLGQAGSLRDAARAAVALGDHATAERQASAGLALWRAQPGAGLADAPASELAARAGALQSELRRIRVECRLHQGRSAGEIGEIESLLAATPLDEELHLLLLRALVDGGRRNDALAAFARFRSALRDQLGISPSASLLRFNTELLRDDSSPVAVQPPGRVRIGLREVPNRLLGRERDLAALEQLLLDSRLATILGPGGLGKTRLAQELAHRSSAPAVVFLELAGVRSGEDVVLALGSILGIREVSSATLKLSDAGVQLDLRERILSVLGERQTLLIVDNCEHVVDAAAGWIADLLASTTTVRILATSRSPLAISGESVYLLDSLTSDDEGSVPGPATQLFMERALAARPGVILPEVTVSRLCTRLDGLPLAIELAAARVRSMSVEEIERRLNNRFALLTGGERTAPARHRTLMAVIDWSWNLLGDDEKALLPRLSLFPDGFDADAVAAVGAASSGSDTTDALEGLVNQSLVSASENPATGLMRYRMLATVREFGELELAASGEEPRVRTAMFAWAQRFATTWSPQLNGRNQVAAFRRVGAEQDNLVSVLREAIGSGDAEVVLAVYAMLGDYWLMRGAHTDVTAFSASVLHATRRYRPDSNHLDAAIAAYSLIATSGFSGDRRTMLLGLGRLRTVKRLGAARDARIEMLSSLVLASTDLVSVERLLARFRASSDPAISSLSSLLRGQLAENAGDVVGAMAEVRRSYELSKQTLNVWCLASAAQSLASLYSQSGDAAEALVWAARSETALGELQASADLQQLSWLIAINEISLGETSRARSVFTAFISEDAESLSPQFADLRAIGLTGLAEIELMEGHTAAGLALYRNATESCRSVSPRVAAWFAVISSGAISAHVAARSPDLAWVEKTARQLRTRLLVTQRAQTDLVDQPVAGTAALGVAVWLTSPECSVRSPELVRTGLQLLAIAQVLGSRQDFPSLNLARHVSAATAQHGSAAVDDARAAIEGLGPMEALTLACDLLRHPGLRLR
ncbi:BTAD domain-containing putative transcriptional regulator [Humibacillus sp. DSM 29435]|uniref:BTAD domain-containing putative transcriptional regulator n=1 Tax=Humibacillus sp. DSM 29435 TaxID=1869167 RepID=UPI0015865CE5|nr:BTAD domain-containing putative transcriptional regulator [Humibacillus sp. DSM 29435]